MTIHVRFRLNKLTGEVEEFLVDDQNQNLPEAEHDRIALEVGQVLVRRPLIVEVLPGSTPIVAEPPLADPEQASGEATPEREG